MTLPTALLHFPVECVDTFTNRQVVPRFISRRCVLSNDRPAARRALYRCYGFCERVRPRLKQTTKGRPTTTINAAMSHCSTMWRHRRLPVATAVPVSSVGGARSGTRGTDALAVGDTEVVDGDVALVPRLE